MGKQTGERAVVLGASMAGLLAARVLADAYAQVTVVDRDELPEASTHRRGVPQGRHVHGLLARGQQALEELFPGLTAELVAHGVPAGDLLADARLFLSGHRLRQAHTGLVAAVRQPTGSRGPHPGPGSRAAQREVPGPLRHRRVGDHARRSPSRRGAGASPGRWQRRGGARRRSRRRRHGPGLAHPGVAGRARLRSAGHGRRYGSGWGTRLGPIGSGATPSAATWRS